MTTTGAIEQLGGFDVPAGQWSQADGLAADHFGQPPWQPMSPTVSAASVFSSPYAADSMTPTTPAESLAAAFKKAEGLELGPSNLGCFEELLAEQRQVQHRIAAEGNGVDPEQLNPKERMFYDVAMHGKFDWTSAAGVKFQRDHGKGSAYALLKSRAEKADYRENWAKTTYAYVLKGKEKSTEYKSVDRSKGTYETFGGIVRSLAAGSGVQPSWVPNSIA